MIDYWINTLLELKFYLRWLFFLLIGIPVLGQNQGEWVQCSGEAVVHNITIEEAQVIAKRQAILNAIEKVCGVLAQAETFVADFMLAGDFINAISYGQVIEETDIVWNTETITPENLGSGPVILLRLDMKAKVICTDEKPDPYFKVDLKLNRTVFHSGEEVILTVKTTKDCYLTVLSLAANDSVYILFPNQIQRDNFIKGDSSTEIPSEIYREAGLHIRVANLSEHKEDTEVVKIIATKHKIDFLNEFDISSEFGLIGTPSTTITKLARWLSEIPVSERAETAIIYSVRAEE